MITRETGLTLGLAALLLAACGADSDDPGAAPAAPSSGKADGWDEANDPARLDDTFLYGVDELPLEGAPKSAPIPGSYWPTSADSINARWDGESSLSPAEKYALAFDRPTLPAQVTHRYGARSAWFARPSCKGPSDCTGLGDSSVCAMARGDDDGFCVPTWWGICHGWAPYAISEPAPLKPVVRTAKDGSEVVFYPGDLDGLMSLLYAGNTRRKLLSRRCESRSLATDLAGRPVEGECRDLNPGSFHVLVGNLLGKRQQSFIYDRTANDEVWNQPVAGFRVTNSLDGKLKEIPVDRANHLLEQPAGPYPFNPAAKRFFEVETDFMYITEAEPARASSQPEAARHMQIEHYRYVLETDADGRILGGEWVGISRTHHPDFVWYPVTGPEQPVAGGLIRYEEVKALVDEAAAP
jgi:hypothetical protein